MLPLRTTTSRQPTFQLGRRVHTRAAQTDDNTNTLTTNAGIPVADNANSLTVGARGPVLLEDFHLLEKLQQFDREQIPERVVHARGATGFGHFEVTKSLSDITDMDIFQNEGTEVPIQARFSTVVHPRGSPETLRDVRGFSVRFQTEQGNWDMVGINIPVFFIRDGMKFPDLIHALKPNPKKHVQEWWRILDFLSFHPESAHALTWLLDDVGVPKDYRHMDGFGVHTYVFVKGDKRTYVKFHWHCDQGVENLTADEAVQVGGTSQSHATTDLYEAIEEGDFPSWTLKVQLMDPADEDKLDYDPLDCTKVWEEEKYPLVEVGRMVLNKNPNNFFTDNEQLAFSPSNVVPGLTFSNDKLLQSRLFSYTDAQRYRLGTNYQDLPINQPRCPFHANEYDGAMQTRQKDEEVDYWPSTFRKEEVTADGSETTTNSENVNGARTKEGIPQTNDFYFPGKRFREMDEGRQERLAQRIAMKATSKGVTDEIRSKWANIWQQCDEKLASMVQEQVKSMMSS